MKWLIENGVFPELQPRLMAVLTERNIPFNVVFTHDATEPEQLTDSVFEPYVFYGSWLTARKIHYWHPEKIGVFFVTDVFDCSNYFPYLHDFLLNGESYMFVPGSELIRFKDTILSNFFTSGKGFIRPDSTDTSLPGQLIFDYVYEESIERQLSHMRRRHDLCLVATTKEIHNEYRFLVYDNKVVCGSSCGIALPQREMTNDDDSWKYTQTVATFIATTQLVRNLPKLFVIDVAALKGNAYKVMKLTSFGISNMFSSNVDAMVGAVQSAMAGFDALDVKVKPPNKA